MECADSADVDIFRLDALPLESVDCDCSHVRMILDTLHDEILLNFAAEGFDECIVNVLVTFKAVLTDCRADGDDEVGWICAVKLGHLIDCLIADILCSAAPARMAEAYCLVDLIIEKEHLTVGIEAAEHNALDVCDEPVVIERNNAIACAVLDLAHLVTMDLLCADNVAEASADYLCRTVKVFVYAVGCVACIAEAETVVDAFTCAALSCGIEMVHTAYLFKKGGFEGVNPVYFLVFKAHITSPGIFRR